MTTGIPNDDSVASKAMLKTTSLCEAHKKLGARMVDFGGWEMPVLYTNQVEEHHAVREAAGLFDVSHMGEIEVKGPDAESLLQKVVTKDVEPMEDGQVILAVLCQEDGGILDDLTVYKFNTEHYLLVVNAGTAQGDYEWIQKHGEGMDAEVVNTSEDVTKIDIQGPNAQGILQELTETNLDEIQRYYFAEIQVDGIDMIVSRSGYTGEDGFELYLPNQHAEQVWDALLEKGGPKGLVPCGLGSRDTLRTECGMMLYGHDIDCEHTPIEAVYGWTVSWEKDFIGKEALREQKEEGLKRKLVGFEMIDRGIAREHYPILINGEIVGEVTSGTPSPSLKTNIGMGYIRYDFRKSGTEIDIDIRGRPTRAKIVKLPFYTPAYKR